MIEIRPSNSTFTYTQEVLVTAKETSTRCRYVNALIIFNGGWYWLLYSTTKSLFEFWIHQSYQVVPVY